jgi:uncharacterized membrane protein
MSAMQRNRRVDRIALVFVFLWFLLGGIAHFAFTATEMRIVPDWIPWPRATVLASGVLELAGAGGLLVARLRRWAAWGLVALTVAVTPANIYMLQHADRFPGVPVIALVLRLPLQLLLLWAIWRVAGMRTRGDGRRPR